MINCRLAEIAGRKKLRQADVVKATEIRPNLISELWRGVARSITMDQMNALCRVLDCQPGDLFEYIEDK